MKDGNKHPSDIVHEWHPDVVNTSQKGYRDACKYLLKRRIIRVTSSKLVKGVIFKKRYYRTYELNYNNFTKEILTNLNIEFDEETILFLAEHFECEDFKEYIKKISDREKIEQTFLDIISKYLIEVNTVYSKQFTKEFLESQKK